METKLKKLVLEGFYHEAENVMLTIPLNAQRDIIMNLAYDTESIAIYGFLRYMLEKNKTKYLLEMKDYNEALSIADSNRHKMVQNSDDSALLELTFLTSLGY